MFAGLEAEADLIFDPRLHIADLDGLQCGLDSLGRNLHHGCSDSQDRSGVAVLRAARQLFAFADQRLRNFRIVPAASSMMDH